MSKLKLVENFSINSKDIKPLPLKESTTIIHEGSTFRCVGAYTFPISRPGQLNLNDRIYGIDLWEKVIRETGGVHFGGLCDHPDDDGSVKDLFCRWSNLRFNEDKSLVLADCYLFGKWGQHAKDAIDAGLPIGFSSVGFGDFLPSPNSNVINPETFSLDRPADWVLNPSYQVYSDEGWEITEPLQADADTELGVAEPEIFENINTNNQKPAETLSEGVEEINKMSTRLVESQMTLQMKGIFKEVKSTTDPAQKLIDCKEALTYFNEDTRKISSLAELEESFKAILKEAEAEVSELAGKGSKLDSVEEALAESEKKVTDLEEQVESLTKALEAESKDLKMATELAETMKTLVEERDTEIETLKNEKSLMFTADEYNALKEAQETPETPIVEADKKDDDDKDSDSGDDADKDKGDEDDKDKDKDKQESVTVTEETPEKPATKEELDEKMEKLKQEKADRIAKREEQRAEARAKYGIEPKVEEDVTGVDSDPYVLAYYEERRQAFPKVVKFKEAMLKCNTLMEAQKLFLENKEEITDTNYQASFEERVFDKPIQKRSYLQEGTLIGDSGTVKIPKGWM